MFDLEWALKGLLVVIAIIACILQLKLFNHINKQGSVNLFITEWMFNPDCLTETGQYFRKAIFGCWMLILALMLVIRELRIG